MGSILEAIAAGVCHGLDSRSLAVGGSVLPFCGRCSGLYAGIAVTVLALAALGKVWSRRLPSRGMIALLAIPWALSGVAWITEFAGVDTAGNAGRAVLGFACGVTGTVMVAPLWAAVVRPVACETKRSAGAAIALAAVVAALGVAAVPACGPAIRYGCASAATMTGLLIAAVGLSALVISAVAAHIQRWPSLRSPDGGWHGRTCADGASGFANSTGGAGR